MVYCGNDSGKTRTCFNQKKIAVKLEMLNDSLTSMTSITVFSNANVTDW